MTQAEHREQVESVVRKFGLRDDWVQPFEPGFLELASKALFSGDPNSSLLGSCLAAWLIHSCIQRRDCNEAIELAHLIARRLRSQGTEIGSETQTTALELRSFLFWFYIDTGHSSVDLIRSSSELLAACFDQDSNCGLRAEAILTHRQEWGLSVPWILRQP